MTLSPKHKIYAGIVACGLAAVITDRLTSVPDSSSIASASSPSQLLVPSSERTATSSTATAAESHSIAELLRAAAGKAGWKPPQTSGLHSAADASGGNGAAQTSTMFLQAHHLRAIVNTAGRACAMLDGRICTIGQTVDGFKLTAISDGAVRFQNGTDRVVMRLPGFHSSASSAGQAVIGRR